MKKIKAFSGDPIVIVEHNNDGSVYVESKSALKLTCSLISKNHPDAEQYNCRFTEK